MAVEFSRNVTFGQYLNLGSPIHRLDPRVKIVGVGLLMVAILSARTFTGLAVALAGAVLIQLLSRIPLGYTLRGMRLVVLATSFIFVFQVLFYTQPVTVWWRWGALSISLEGLLQALLVLGRVLLIYHLISTLLFATSLVDLTDGVETMVSPLKRVGVPVHELVLTFMIALKFVPLLVAELERMVKAMAARGVSLDRGGLIARARVLGGLLVPLFVNALARAEVLTAAMNARCYRGGQGRTKRRVLRMAPRDGFVLLAVALLAAAIFVVGRMAVL
jgi:energy-coupling factor transport system permease protein